MIEKSTSPTVRENHERVAEIFNEHQRHVTSAQTACSRADGASVAGGVAAALWVSPKAWAGSPVTAPARMGSGIPGRRDQCSPHHSGVDSSWSRQHQYTVAVGQMLMGRC